MKRLVSSLVVVLFAASCNQGPGSVGKRTGETDVVGVESEDPVMNAAIKIATSTLPSFKALLSAPPAGASGFAVKAAFPSGSNSQEHIWLINPTFSGGIVSGVVNNEPVDVPSIKLGQQVSAPEAHVSDWLYLQDGVLHGGFTLRVLLERMSPEERARMVKNMGVRLE